VNKVLSYTDFHNAMYRAKDIDPSITCLRYIANRYELNIEQRYWLCFLYGTCYCAVTVFFIYNEFPDFETVDVDRLERWWKKYKKDLIFQTDRARIRSNDQFVESFISYKSLVKNNQRAYFHNKTWQEVYKSIERIKYFGRFTLFNYLDTLNQITDVNVQPPHLDLENAESCTNGLLYAIGKEKLVDKKLTSQQYKALQGKMAEIRRENVGNIFQIETTLCAYKKYRKGQRYVGYYIDRMRKEIQTMEKRITDGVCWDVLWEFRKETFDAKYLLELT
jgi:hypothetical protein